jgi:hypothetical protein
VTKCLDYQWIPLVGILAADIKNDFTRNTHLLAKSLPITVSPIFDPTADNVYGHLIMQRPEVLELKLSVDQQPVSSTKQTMIQRIISGLKGVTRRLNQEGDMLEASGSFHSKTHQGGRLSNMMNYVNVLTCLSCRVNGLHFIQAHAQRRQSLARNTFGKEPLHGSPLFA